MSDEVLDDDVVLEADTSGVDEGVVGDVDEDVEFVESDADESTPDFGGKLKDIEGQLGSTKEKLDIAERLEKGFANLGESLSRTIQQGQPVQTVKEPDDPDIAWMNSLTKDDYANGLLTNGDEFNKRLMTAQKKVIQRENQTQFNSTLRMTTQMYVNSKMGDPDDGEYIKKYKKEIIDAAATMNPALLSNPDTIDQVIDFVLSKHRKEIIADAVGKRHGSSKPPSPTLAKSGGSGGAKKSIDLNKMLGAGMVREMRDRGLSDKEIYQYAKDKRGDR